VKIETPFKENSLNQIMQQKATKMAFCRREGDKIVQCHQYVICRDYFNEVIASHATGDSYTVYGFQYQKDAKNYLNPEKQEFLYSVPNEPDRKAFEKNISILNDIEKNAGLSLTTIEKVDPTVYYLCGDPFWRKTNYLNSLYTFLLRALAYEFKDQANWIEELSKQETNEGGYIRSVGVPRVKYILKNIAKAPILSDPTGLVKNKKVENTSTLHNYTGWVSTFRKSGACAYNETYRPHIEKFLGNN